MDRGFAVQGEHRQADHLIPALSSLFSAICKKLPWLYKAAFLYPIQFFTFSAKAIVRFQKGGLFIYHLSTDHLCFVIRSDDLIKPE